MTTGSEKVPAGPLASPLEEFGARYAALGAEIDRINAAWKDLTAVCEPLMAQPITEEHLTTREDEAAIKARFGTIGGALYRLFPGNTDYRPSGEPLQDDVFAQRARDLAIAADNIGKQIDSRRARLSEIDQAERDRKARAAAYAREIEEAEAKHQRKLAGSAE